MFYRGVLHVQNDIYWVFVNVYCWFSDLNDDVIKALQTARRVGKIEEEEKKISVNDMETCFGFDVSCTNLSFEWDIIILMKGTERFNTNFFQEDEDEDDERRGKETITLLSNIDWKV